MPHAELSEVCFKLIKFKKENKELLHYLLFESGDEKTYVKNLKQEVDAMFEEVNTQTVYWAKKTIRKILRWINKYCRFSGQATTQIELLLYFCSKMNELPLHWSDSKVMINLYQSQLKKTDKLLLTLHEDLQFDYRENVNRLKEI